jgi:hypothetical protein
LARAVIFELDVGHSFAFFAAANAFRLSMSLSSNSLPQFGALASTTGHLKSPFS